MMGARVIAGFQVTVSASEGHVDLPGLTAEIEGKLEFRGRNSATFCDEFRKKEARLKKV